VAVTMVDARDGGQMRVRSPEGFEAGDASTRTLRFIFTAFTPFRRVLSANWFVPVARVGEGGYEQHLLTKSENVFTARKNGELFLFVNDAIAPVGLKPLAFGWDSYYHPKNNTGMLHVTVTRMP